MTPILSAQPCPSCQPSHANPAKPGADATALTWKSRVPATDGTAAVQPQGGMCPEPLPLPCLQRAGNDLVPADGGRSIHGGGGTFAAPAEMQPGAAGFP